MFTRASQKRGAADLLGTKLIAYFCAEYGIGDNLPIYSGGLGVLAGDIVQEAALLKLPFVSVGLFYKKGFFHQILNKDGQQEVVRDINPKEVPLELVTDKKGETLLIEVPINERIVYAQVWRYRLQENSLYLLDTDHWKNNDTDRLITDQLYGGDQGKRIQQELVLGVGGFRCLKQLGLEPNLYHMNEGHSAFLALELISHLHLVKRMSPDTAVNAAKRQLVFTNHTLVPAGNDVFSHDQIRYYLGLYAHESGIGIDKVLELGGCPTPGMFAMTSLAMRMASVSNAVSKLHAKKAKDLWPEFKFESVTNGIHLPSWVAPELQHLWDEIIPTWQLEASNLATWKPVRKLAPEKLWVAHQYLKEQMLNEVYSRTGIQLDVDALTIVWARRFATYKRPDLLFKDIERLKKLLFNADRPMQVIIAGKSHPADGQGKQIIEHINNLANFELKHRAVFVDDYSLSLAKLLVSGADVWLNTPIFGLEASGTSGMKASANGVIQCTVPDGWAYEVDWRGIGFVLAPNKAEDELYSLLEKRIVPAYYKRNAQGVPEYWTFMMKETIAELSPRFSSQRMVEEYVQKLYVPTLASNQ
jgi:starch phosphorylase